ncbi:MAG: hypothetical protein HC836_49025 [Richelia sp. RM2_1_2]|nr:hypothetical protein [Richelia sp. RM2_1_2]
MMNIKSFIFTWIRVAVLFVVLLGIIEYESTCSINNSQSQSVLALKSVNGGSATSIEYQTMHQKIKSRWINYLVIIGVSVFVLFLPEIIPQKRVYMYDEKSGRRIL